MIKMPEAVGEIIKAGEKPAASLSLVQAETTQQLGMFESGVLHSSLKPIVKAKVNKVANYIRATQDEYAHGTEDQKKEIQNKASSLIMQSMGTRGANGELCELLWSLMTDLAGALSFFYCPSIAFPSAFVAGAPPYSVVKGSGASRLRSAFLTEYFWEAMLSASKSKIKDMLGAGVMYYWGASDGAKGYTDVGPHAKMPKSGGGLTGKNMVEVVLPYIGFPVGSKLSNPVDWHCDTTTCIAPVRAWAWHSNYCLTTFSADGLVTEVIIPLSLWR